MKNALLNKSLTSKKDYVYIHFQLGVLRPRTLHWPDIHSSASLFYYIN